MPDAPYDGEGIIRIRLQNVALWALVLGLIVLLANQLLEGVPEFKKIPLVETLSNEIGFALLIAAILVFTTEKQSRAEFNRIFERYLNILEKTMTQKLSEIYGTMVIAKFPEQMETLTTSPF